MFAIIASCGNQRPTPMGEREAGKRNNGDIIALDGESEWGINALHVMATGWVRESMKVETFEASDWNLVNLKRVNEIVFN